MDEKGKTVRRGRRGRKAKERKRKLGLGTVLIGMFQKERVSVHPGVKPWGQSE